MIAESSSGHAFGGLIRYLLHGRSGEEHSRVAWTMPRNLALDDPERAAVLMRATASQNDRVQQPVYHLIVSFDPSDRPSAALMRQVAERVLDELGLKDHQALIVAHRDRAHAHMHFVINRVDPDTGRAWDRWHDHTKAERALRILERQLGLREVDGHLHQLEGQRPPERRPDEPTHRHDRVPPSDDLNAEQFERVNEAKQRIYDADLWRHLERLNYIAQQQFAVDEALLSRSTQARRALHDATERFYHALEDVFERPLAAKEAFDHVMEKQGPGAAIRRLREDPTSYVEFIQYTRRAFFGLLQKDDDSISRALLPKAIAAARDYAAAITDLHKVERQIDPGLSRSDLYQRSSPETELAAHRARMERELDRIQQIRERFPQEQVRRRALSLIQNFGVQEIAYMRRALGSAAITLSAIVQDRTIRQIALGRDID